MELEGGVPQTAAGDTEAPVQLWRQPREVAVSLRRPQGSLHAAGEPLRVALLPQLSRPGGIHHAHEESAGKQSSNV